MYRERKLEHELLLNGKTFQINLERNADQSQSILSCLAPLLTTECLALIAPIPFRFFMNMHCIGGSPEGKHFKNVSN